MAHPIKCCSSCNYYNRTYKLCKVDNSQIIGNTYITTLCKQYDINSKYLPINNR